MYQSTKQNNMMLYNYLNKCVQLNDNNNNNNNKSKCFDIFYKLLSNTCNNNNVCYKFNDISLFNACIITHKKRTKLLMSQIDNIKKHNKN